MYQLLYENNFVKKVLVNYENNLCKFLGTTVSDNIGFVSEIIRKKEVNEKRIKGILLDLLAIFKYFEKPVQALLSDYFPYLVVEDKEVVFLIMWSLFFAEFSNIPNCFNYLLIKAKANPNLIKKVKFYQFYGFLIGRVFLTPFMFAFDQSDGFTDDHLLFLKIGFGILYPMSLFWTYKLYIGLNK